MSEQSIAELLDSPEYQGQISLAAARGDECLVVKFTDLYNYDPELAVDFLHQPDKRLIEFNGDALQAVRRTSPEYGFTIRQFTVRIRGIPIETRIRRINSEHINHTIQVNGIAKAVSVVQPLLVKAVFRCNRCGVGIAEITQDSQFLVYPQRRCEENNCGGAKWELLPQASTYVDRQWMTVQEAIENLPPGQLPRDFKLELKGALCHAANPGDRVRVVAVVDVLQKRVNDTDKELEIYGRTIDVDVLNQEEELEVTEEAKARIHELSEAPNLDEMMVESIAPSLYGMREEKLSCILQLFGGVPKEVNGSRIRGDIHVLLLGDPSTGKSQLLKFTSELSPRGMFTTGRGSSGVGLTASVVKEKDQGYVLEAGALVISDHGYCAIDEIDKMSDEDRSTIHPAMEQQVISISKAGINAELNCRCAIGAAGNPKEGRWDPYRTILVNMDMPVTILNRFDLIWIMRDQPREDEDRAAAKHIIDYHSERAATPPIAARTVKQYILYARHIKPRLTAEVGDRIQQFYMSLRKRSTQESNQNSIMITPRQLESVIRLTEAHARLHLREEATLEDAEAAIRLVNNSVEKAGFDPEKGEVDLTNWYRQAPRTLKDQMEAAVKIVTRLGNVTDGGVAVLTDVEEQMGRAGIEPTWVGRVLDALVRDGAIYYPRPGVVSLT